MQAKILVVEDNRETQLIIKSIFRNSHKLQFVDNDRDANSLLLKDNFDIVLLDLNLKEGGNGKNILIKIRQDERIKSIPVIIITAYDLNLADEKFFRENASAIIPKPIDKKLLSQTVQKLLPAN